MQLYSSSLQNFNDPTVPRDPTAAKSGLAGRQSKSGNDPLEIVRSVVLDFNPPAFISVVNRDVRRQMLLQPIL
jgi:hypothetical protein